VLSSRRPRARPSPDRRADPRRPVSIARPRSGPPPPPPPTPAVRRPPAHRQARHRQLLQSTDVASHHSLSRARRSPGRAEWLAIGLTTGNDDAIYVSIGRTYGTHPRAAHLLLRGRRGGIVHGRRPEALGPAADGLRRRRRVRGD